MPSIVQIIYFLFAKVKCYNDEIFLILIGGRPLKNLIPFPEYN